ncbi:hypothetical protein N657DRAFT_128793 [Parathielavia appendiculata]|uniref:Uncharacterized protein n=1 Tax=Parathielavia appendiculata TaxID=2587402 RepID=A0AAN6TVC0_9PEZI|nr:hypothetical protein N657DRAFT_128793 [Parathielavia appendiculata]
MTEPENFDDELFADLYNDDEPPAKPTGASAPDQYSATQAAAPEAKEGIENGGQQQDYNGGGDATHMKYEDEEEEEDDDEIDFNLGNGPSAAVSHRDHDDQHDEKPSYSAPPAAAPATKGPNAKEDG